MSLKQYQLHGMVAQGNKLIIKQVYESVLTNDYKAIIPKSKGYTQLSLF